VEDLQAQILEIQNRLQLTVNLNQIMQNDIIKLMNEMESLKRICSLTTKKDVHKRGRPCKITKEIWK